MSSYFTDCFFMMSRRDYYCLNFITISINFVVVSFIETSPVFGEPLALFLDPRSCFLGSGFSDYSKK